MPGNYGADAHFPNAFSQVEICGLRLAKSRPSGGCSLNARCGGCARPHCGQEGDNLRFSPSCQSPSFPSGRAARVKVSGAFHLPPNCYCDRQGIGCHPSGAHPPGTRPERRLHANSNRKPYIASTPASRVRRKTKLPRRYRKSNFSTACGQNLFAVAGTREHPPAGVIRKRGSRPPLVREEAAQAAFQSVKYGHFHPPFQAKSPGCALRAHTGESQRRTP